MSISKIYKRWQVWAIFFLVIIAVIRFRIDTKPLVSGGNPPIIEFDGRRAQLYITGPYSLEQLRQEYKTTGENNALTAERQKELEKIRDNKNSDIWQLDPGSLSRGFAVSIKYGIVPNGFRQIYPANGKQPEPLIEGKIYAAVAPSDDTSDVKSEYFMIDNNKAITVLPRKMLER